MNPKLAEVHSSSSVRLELSGRLGNQLFIYYAGLAASNISGSSLSLVAAPGVDNEISRFTVSAEIRGRSLGERISKRLVDASSLMFGNRLLGKILRPEGAHFGLDEFFLRSAQRGVWQGYFQDYRYFDLVPEYLQGIELREEGSCEYQKLRKLFLSEPQVMIHVRRGDYREPASAEFYGLLDSEYFTLGLERLSPILKGSNLWVASDEQAYARHFALKFGARALPDELSGAETLSIMKLSVGFVLSNSSFSYWAARLSRSENIVRPSPWFRGWPDFDPCPPSWAREPASWSQD